MNRPGNKEIQFALHANYGSNVERYDEWHAYFRRFRPPMLVVWGRGDFVFTTAGAEAYTADLPDAEIRMRRGSFRAGDARFRNRAIHSTFLDATRLESDR
jgi:pimeloyl-ACP methyl ester carboxylesterase